MNPEKRPKLDAEPENEKSRIPDDVLFKIFSLLSVRDRMRLSLVSKRFRQLVSKRTVWKDINLLSVTLELNGEIPEPGTTINGHKFGTQTRTRALELLLEKCAPLKRVEITACLPSSEDMPWLNLCLDRLLEAQIAAGKGAPPELSFRGSLFHAPVVFEKLIDGAQTKIDVEIGAQRLDLYQFGIHMENFGKIWSKVATCNGVTEVNFSCVQDWLFLSQEAPATALSGKESLQRLCFKLLDYYGFRRYNRFIQNVAAIANSCPRLVAVHCDFAMVKPGSVNPPLVPLLEPATRHRLQELAISGTLTLDHLRTLATQFPNLTRLNIDIRNAATFAGFFLAEHEFGARILAVDLSYAAGDFENRRTHCLDLENGCDSFAMASDGRSAFVKGSAVVACKFVEINWPG